MKKEKELRKPTEDDVKFLFIEYIPNKKKNINTYEVIQEVSNELGIDFVSIVDIDLNEKFKNELAMIDSLYNSLVKTVDYSEANKDLKITITKSLTYLPIENLEKVILHGVIFNFKFTLGEKQLNIKTRLSVREIEEAVIQASEDHFNNYLDSRDFECINLEKENIECLVKATTELLIYVIRQINFELVTKLFEGENND